ncbi:MAG: T9SS type A sorting domain-containing protein [Ignavibacteriales bacterium]|nr:T9SS type A sorting domain-containing protein [Ignavibacteriales bacterium]
MNNKRQQLLILFFMILAISSTLVAQPKRADAIWARTVPVGSITVDGKLNEPVWAKAESIYVQYGKIAGLPGSGFTAETGTVFDSTRAVVKFLIMGDSLYLAFSVKDSSIGGGNFGAADAIIFNIRDKSNPANRPSPSTEFLWGWINEAWMNPGSVTAVGGAPSMGPKEKNYTAADYETATVVRGISNSDTAPDTGYTVEMKINIKRLGYNASGPAGDILMFNVAIRDCDWFWPVQDWVTFSRVWIQGPWANVNEKNFLRIHVRPDVTTTSGTVPVIKPDYVIPNGKLMAAPTIDGQLDEAVWSKIPGFDIRFGDAALRDSYPLVGPFASGQYQPTVNGGTAAVYDSSKAKIKMFFKGNMLYVGVDVQDQVVQFKDVYDRWDGIMLTVNGIGKDYQNQTDHDQNAVKLSVIVGKTGKDSLKDYFPTLRDSLKGAQVVLKLKPNTTVDTLGNDVDEGYQVEEAIDLTKLGYPSGLGDGVLYLGVTFFDGDSYIPTSLSYGTRTWWFRERDGVATAAYVYMDSTLVMTDVGKTNGTELPTEFELLGSYPNPFNPATTIKFNLPFDAAVSLTVYDMLGRSVSNGTIGEFRSGVNTFRYEASGLSSGVYFYQLRAHSTTSGRESSTPFTKIMLMK